VLIFSSTVRWWHTDYNVYECSLNYVWLEVGLTLLDFLIHFPARQRRRKEEWRLFGDIHRETPRCSTCLLSYCRTVDMTGYRTDNQRFTCRTSCHYAGSKDKEVLLHCTCRLPHKDITNPEMPLKGAHELIIDFSITKQEHRSYLCT
jgi:hypothetical protein